MFKYETNVSRLSVIHVAARVAQRLEQKRKDLVILASPVQIPLWDVGASPSDETE
jgi:hypothetical protein